MQLTLSPRAARAAKASVPEHVYQHADIVVIFPFRDQRRFDHLKRAPVDDRVR